MLAMGEEVVGPLALPAVPAEEMYSSPGPIEGKNKLNTY
jgi:hypothetical protein